MSALFPGTREHRQEVEGTGIFARIGGAGPPLLLVHGFPQTHAMWHRLAPVLMQHFTCVMPDLRGYGRSACPPNTPGNEAYSKRVMAQDLVGLMAGLGYDRFTVVGHDRGARVGYRMALDHPNAVSRLAVLDIVPTYAMWRNFTVRLAMKTYHWLFLAQPAPLPEMLIGGNPVAFLDYTIASWTKDKSLSSFSAEALADYRTCFAQAERIHAACNDYRAGATCDLAADEQDRAQGRMITCPLLALWGSAGIPSETASPLAAWREWCASAEGHGIDSGHFLAEENPEATLAALLPFLRRDAH